MPKQKQTRSLTGRYVHTGPTSAQYAIQLSMRELSARSHYVDPGGAGAPYAAPSAKKEKFTMRSAVREAAARR